MNGMVEPRPVGPWGCRLACPTPPEAVQPAGVASTALKGRPPENGGGWNREDGERNGEQQVVLRAARTSAVEVLSKVVLGNEAPRLAEYRPERAGVEFLMSGDREGLAAHRCLPTELDVAPPLRDNLETELAEDADDLEAREPTKPWHMSDVLR